jgi:hypothetical protein
MGILGQHAAMAHLLWGVRAGTARSSVGVVLPIPRAHWLLGSGLASCTTEKSSTTC